MVGTLDFESGAISVAASGRWAFAGMTDGQVEVVDVLDPANPTPLTSVNTGADDTKSVFAGATLVVSAEGEDGVFVIDRGCTAP